MELARNQSEAPSKVTDGAKDSKKSPQPKSEVALTVAQKATKASF